MAGAREPPGRMGKARRMDGSELREQRELRASVPALGLSFPSCIVKLLEFLRRWCLGVAVLSRPAVGA